jgi:hypothetical protein
MALTKMLCELRIAVRRVCHEVCATVQQRTWVLGRVLAQLVLAGEKMIEFHVSAHSHQRSRTTILNGTQLQLC